MAIRIRGYRIREDLLYRLHEQYVTLTFRSLY
jgi:hypothetical protein